MTTVLVTGAAGHLGTAMVEALSGGDTRLALNDIDGDAVGRLATSTTGAQAFPADVGDPVASERLVEEVVERFGSLDVVVNAAGIEGPIAPIESLGPVDVERTFAVNVLSMFWVCRAAVPALRRGPGRIINLASGAGLAGGEYASAYHASKHAVVGLTRSLARELGPDGIAVNAVCPGFVESPMVSRIVGRLEELEGRELDIESGIPVGRMVTPEEVAAPVRFLAFDAPTSMTGECLVIDGGLRA